MLAYADTRGLDTSRPAFTDVVLKGMADGGGLYVPSQLPGLLDGWIAQWPHLPYAERALELLRLFDVDLPDRALSQAVTAAYGHSFDHVAVAPVHRVTRGRYVLELFHGPTCAFKDMALQLMPALFSEAAKARRGGPDGYLILVATSGDTGKAALEGYKDRDAVRIAVLYPKDGVSDLQELQMVTQEGSNVAVLAVLGDFDACQAAAKATFADEGFAARLAEHGLALSSANSINWGRVLPQIVYYASAYADMAHEGAMGEGDPIDVAVPTGNFGNILAAYYARAMGVPIRRLICASNENRVLADFLETGVYDLTGRSLVATPSPSMDILVSSNLERLLYDAAAHARGGAPGAAMAVREWMRELAAERRFEVDAATMEKVRRVFVGDSVTNDETLATVREVFEEHRYLLDPHTAVAWRAADRLAGQAASDGAPTPTPAPVLVVATAHWAKFGADVYKALTGSPYAGQPADIAGLGPVEVLRRVSELAGGAPIPRSLAALGDRPVRFSGAIGADPASVQDALLEAVHGWEGPSAG